MIVSWKTKGGTDQELPSEPIAMIQGGLHGYLSCMPCLTGTHLLSY